MKMLFFNTRWGSEDIPFEEFAKRTADAGYQGIETGIPATMGRDEIKQFFDACGKFGLDIILQHHDTIAADFNTHQQQYRRWFEKIKPFRPLLINSQTGRDFFSQEQNLELIYLAERYSAEQDIPLVHETHRGKFSFACHVTAGYLKAAPQIRLALDISHWVNTAESFLEDQQQAVELALSRTAHIHARVGFPEGPQISDPRDPQWSQAVEVHCKWWDTIVAMKRQQSPPETLTITTEFGPYPYLINLPFTSTPIANQQDINLHMMHLLKNRYRDETAGSY